MTEEKVDFANKAQNLDRFNHLEFHSSDEFDLPTKKNFPQKI